MTEQRVGRYILGTELGRDAISVTQDARDSLLGRRVVLRLFVPPQTDDARKVQAAAARFAAETRAQAGLSHPGTPAVLDAGEMAGTAFAVFEAPDGRPIGEALEMSGPLPLHTAASVAKQVLAVLAHAHACGVCHGGLSAAGVLVTSAGRATVLDVRRPEPDDPLERARLEAADLKAAAKLLWAMMAGISAPMPGGVGALDERTGIPPRLARAVTSALYQDRAAGPYEAPIGTCQEMLAALEDRLLLSRRVPTAIDGQVREDLSGSLARAALAVGAGLALVTVLCQIWEFGVLGAVASACAMAVGERARGAIAAVAGLAGGLLTFLAR